MDFRASLISRQSIKPTPSVPPQTPQPKTTFESLILLQSYLKDELCLKERCKHFPPHNNIYSRTK